MVMSGTGERVVFVLDEPGDESLLTGGTIARLLDDGAEVTVLFGSSGAAGIHSAAVADAREALGGSDPASWRVLAGEPDAADRRQALGEAITGAQATAVVAGAADPVLRQSVIDAAGEYGVPVYLASAVAASAGARLTAIDVSDQLDRKLAALAAYDTRWQLQGRVARQPDGTETLVGGSETYLRPGAAEHPVAADTPTVATRVLAIVMALAAGVLFGVLGTVAHQTTVELAGATLPVGLVLSLTAACTLLVGLRLVVGDRLVVLAAAAGLLGTVFLLSLRSTGGSVLVPQGMLGIVWTMAPALVAALVVAWPRIPARRPTA